MRSIGYTTMLIVLPLVFTPAADVAEQPTVWASAATATPQHHGPEFEWPLHGDPPVTNEFERPAGDYGAGHRGVDLAADPGQHVHAAAAGTVGYAGQLAGRGVVAVKHKGGLRTTYEPVDPDVSAGDRVRQGQVIGSVSTGHHGCAEQACLHWGVRRGRDYLDPLVLVRDDITVELKPWEPTHAGSGTHP